MINKGKKIFIGAAWPYANNSLHLGHVSALIGADILARYFRQSGANVLYVSGSDCHGTPIEVAAEEQKTEPEVVALKYHQEFRETLIDGLNFSYDNYTNTLTENHSKMVQEIFLKLYETGKIYKKTEVLPYCSNCKRYLPDRYIEGICPKCSYKQARGDQCDECATLLDPKDLIDPKCKICLTKPEFKESEHFFLRLSESQKELEEFVNNANNWRVNAKGFANKYLTEGLKDRAVTRDTKWGIPIPVPGYEDKSIYVWFEAVCGYLTASVEYAKKLGSPDLWREFWQSDSAYHYYVHGKDNIPFHAIIWTAILKAYDDKLHLPDSLISSEYLTLEKKQFSKSRKWAVWLPDFLKNFDGMYLRYHLIANGPETSDSDFSWKEFQERINKELIGNFANFIHRSFHLIENNFNGKLARPEKYDETQNDLLEKTISGFEVVGSLIEAGRFREALRHVFEVAEAGNKFLAQNEPWKTINTDKEKASTDLFVCGQVIYSLATLLKPFVPELSEKIEIMLGKGNDDWQFSTIESLEIKNSAILVKKIEDSQIEEELKKLG